MNAINTFLNLTADRDAGRITGLTSVCSAHPLVIEAGLIEARAADQIPCIEATCNQVNQDGGYTGMTPQGFRDLVAKIAATLGIEMNSIVLGGDHLGPNPWRDLQANEAMDKAIVMTRDYAAAGFGKIHLDASMSCADDPTPLPPATVAARAALLAQAAEEGAAAGGFPAPGYIIGTEVPVPGGAAEALDHVEVTTPDDAAATVALHVKSFTDNGLEDALKRIVALVVQPGVEFGQTDLHTYDRKAAQALTDWRNSTGGIVFEAHSTDYQTPTALSELVQDGYAILKVGPGLTLALREAYYQLDQLAGEISADYAAGSLPEAMEQLMLANPKYWQPYVDGDAAMQKHQRHEGLSDRIRYLWPAPEAVEAINRLMSALGQDPISVSFIQKYLPQLAADSEMTAEEILIAAVRNALSGYTAACAQS
ncbi:class II D-tagatose-bisphosphate aldolase non-catalytic subunit [Falsihalocynthiibacter sp. SS001]|uniref:class II D-tagatose-bisphosphate aldolase non-catalytic subunit n=1 Tax=Falsihalocynthiibacter sp. SS001 TaxID=3349698 RepID=UPI0036D28778